MIIIRVRMIMMLIIKMIVIIRNVYYNYYGTPTVNRLKF